MTEGNVMRWDVNLLEDGSVVTRDGEYLGTWDTDENDHPMFTPDGATEMLIFDVRIGTFCDKIAEWHAAKNQP